MESYRLSVRLSSERPLDPLDIQRVAKLLKPAKPVQKETAGVAAP